MQKLTVIGDLPSMNEIINTNRKNRYAGASKKKSATELVALYAKTQLKEIKNKVDLEVTWFCESRRKDKDNIASGLKFILDGVQMAGKLKNDGWKEIGDIHHFFKVDKVCPRVEVIFRETNDDR